MRKVLIVSAAVVLAAASFVYFMMKGPDLRQYEPLKEPRIIVKPDIKVLETVLKGDPNQTASTGFVELFKVYFKIKEAPKPKIFGAPMARWTAPGKDMKEWTGIFGLPIPENIDKLPEGVKSDKCEIKINTWKYGEAAEILHIGGYDKVEPAIEKLLNFVKEKGYKTAGDHEEEYVKGPGMLFKGNPDNYYTIIRYPVVKETAPSKKK
jgi:hypothetical protein